MLIYSPYDRDTAHNPFPTYRRMREEAPVYHNEELGFYALSRYDDVVEAHLTPEVFSSAKGTTLDGSSAGTPFLIVKDPPEHTAHRRIVGQVFTPRRMAQLEPFIRATAGRLLDGVADRSSFDLVEDYSIKLPLDVISELLGLPEDLRPQVHELSDVIAAGLGTPGREEATLAAFGEFYGLLGGVIAQRRSAPGDDVITLLMMTEVEEPDGTKRYLTDEELASRFLEMAFAGHETVAKLIPNGVVALSWNPDQRKELVEEPALIPRAVEEMLRWDPPSHYQGRATTRDVELHGVVIPAGSRVLLMTAAALHDDRQFPDPECFDIRREIERHVAFGFGKHVCLGASLARLETAIAFEELLRRYPEWELSETGIERHYSGNVRGLKHLPLHVAPPVRV